MKIGAYESHPIADALPLMDDRALHNLAEDIKQRGLRRKIVLWEGKILDGRCRGIACEMAKVEPEYEEHLGDDPIGFVASENVYGRRHLNDAQRALSLQRLTKLNRQHVKAGEKQASLILADKETDALVATAKKQGCAELVKAMDLGEVTAGVAAAVSQLDDDTQRAWLKDQREPAEPVRAKAEKVVKLETVAIELSPVDAIALKAGYTVWNRSIHGEVNAAAALLKKMVPFLRGMEEKT